MNDMNDMNGWLTLQEVSKITGKSPAALRRLIQRGVFERVKKEPGKRGNRWVIHQDELAEEDVHERQERTPVHDSRSEGVQVNTITFETFIEQQKEWENQRDELRAGLMMYRFKFEELDRRMKLLPAPPELVTHKLQEMEARAKDLEAQAGDLEAARQEAEQARQELERTTRAKVDLEMTLQKLRAAQEQAQKERDEAQARLDESKAQVEELRQQAPAEPADSVDFDTLNKIRQLETFNKKLQLNLDEKAKMLEHVNKKFSTAQVAIRQAEEQKDQAVNDLAQAKEAQEALSTSLQEAQGQAQKARERAEALEEQRRKEAEEKAAQVAKLEEERAAEVDRLEKEKAALAQELEREKSKGFFARLKELFFKEV